MSVLPQILESAASVSAWLTYASALAVACLLQYVLYLTNVSRLQRLRRTLESVMDRLACLESERALGEAETRMLRRIADAASVDEAVESLLDFCAPKLDADFAMLLQLHPDGRPKNRWARGLSLDSLERTMLDQEWLVRLETESVLQLAPREVQRSRFVELLSEDEIEKVGRLVLIRMGDSDPPEAVLLTTNLSPEAASFSGRVELAQRLAGSLSSFLRRTETLRSQQDELRLTRELLELRRLVDTHAGSPADLLDEFLRRLCTATGFDRATLHLTSGSRLDSKPLVRTGSPLPRGIGDLWKLDEAVLAGRGLKTSGLLFFDAGDLHALRVRSTMCGALVASLMHNETLIGVVSLSRQSDEPIAQTDRQLLRWAIDFLTETILKTVDRAMIEQQARRDALTQLANRYTFDREIKRHVEQAIRGDDHCSLVLLDIDRFKTLNDRFGHLAGDEVLRRIARLIESCVARTRVADRPLVARYGGEELAVLLPGVTAEGGMRVAAEIVTEVRQAQIPHEDRTLHVTISAGVADCPRHGTSPDELIAAADNALYHAKQNGRDRYEVAATRSDPDAREPAPRRPSVTPLEWLPAR